MGKQKPNRAKAMVGRMCICNYLCDYIDNIAEPHAEYDSGGQWRSG